MAQRRWPGLGLLLAALLALAAVASAQYGHPLKGSWSGDWGTNADTRTRVLIDLDWDGKAVTGTLNPGSDNVPLTATLDGTTWSVRIDGEGKDAAGNPVRYVIEGKLENIGAPYRTLSGTWTQGAVTGDFRLRRN